MMIGAVVSLLLLEVLFRLCWTLPPAFAEFGQAGMYIPGEDGTPMLEPGYRGMLRFGSDQPNRVTINQQGMRGAEIAVRSSTQKRILIGGDSLVFGYGVEDDESLPACIERGLQKASVPAVVGNGGVPGFGSSHTVSRMVLLDREFEADALVVCGFLGNDAIDDALPTRVVYGGLVHGWPMSQLVQTSLRTRLAIHSRVALWIEAWIFTNKPEWSPLLSAVPDPRDIERGAGLPPPGNRLAGLFLDARDDNISWPSTGKPVLPRLRGYLRESLQRAKKLAGTRPLVFVVLPTSWHINLDKRTKVLKQQGMNPQDFELGLAQRRWMELAKELGIPAFDATPILRAAGRSEDLFIRDGGHLTVKGNKIVGQWLAEELRTILP